MSAFMNSNGNFAVGKMGCLILALAKNIVEILFKSPTNRKIMISDSSPSQETALII
jgi:hypothetical protein